MARTLDDRNVKIDITLTMTTPRKAGSRLGTDQDGVQAAKQSDRGGHIHTYSLKTIS